MFLFDYIKFAFKNLTRQKTRTFLTIVAITIGSLSLILMASIMLSIRQTITDQMQNLGAFDLVTVMRDPNADSSSLVNPFDNPEGKKIDDTTLAQIRQLPHIKAATTTISGFGLGRAHIQGETKMKYPSIVAIDPNNNVLVPEAEYGRKLETGDMDKILAGRRMIEDFGYTNNPQALVGKTIVFEFKMGPGSAPDWGALPEKPPMNADKSWYEENSNKGVEITAQIIGIAPSGIVDDGASYITTNWARRLLNIVSWQWNDCGKEQKTYQTCQSVQTIQKDDRFTYQGYSSVIAKVDDTANLDTVAASIKALGYGANTAKTMLDQINRILLLISVVLAVIGGISLFVATIGIINTMVMATYERTREIGVLRACGATRATIRHLFTIEAGLLGFWGGVFGLLISLGLGRLAGIILANSNASLGALPLDHIGDFPIWLVIAVIAFTTVLGMLSGLFPAIRAARLNPVEALRYE